MLWLKAILFHYFYFGSFRTKNFTHKSSKMAYIDLSNIFFQLRNNYSNNNFHEINDDQEELIPKHSSNNQNNHDHKLDLSHLNMPSTKPVWTTGTDSIKRKLTECSEILKDLKDVQEKILAKPLSFDLDQDSSNATNNNDSYLSPEDHELHKKRSNFHDEITSNLHFCEKKLKSFNTWRSKNKAKISSREFIIMENMSGTLAEKIQSMTSDFSKQNNSFSEKLEQKNSTKTLNETNLISIETEQPSKNTAILEEINLTESTNRENILQSEANLNGPSLKQVAIQNQLKRKIDHRENAITNVTKDIYELNKLFKEVATMVVEQGSVMDRIDYNIDQTAEKVELGHEELEKARSYQKKNKKLNVIACEAVTVVFLFLLFVWRHS